MKTFRTRRGPFAEQPYYTNQEIERTCAEELRAVGLFPEKPEPIQIDLFIEKRFKVRVLYEDVPPSVLGYTHFGRNGVQSVVVSRALAEERTAVSERRLSTTLAHEAGHCLLHAHLFAFDEPPASLFGSAGGDDRSRILCRDGDVDADKPMKRAGYDGRWWEVQANKAMAALLLPSSLVEVAISSYLNRGSGLSVPGLPAVLREEAARRTALVFEVNPVVARIRLNVLYPASDQQLTL